MNASRVRHLPLATTNFGVFLSIAVVILIRATTFAQSIGPCDETGLRAAIQQGGTIKLQCDRVITLSQPIVISNNVTLDGTGYNVVLSGGDTVQLFQVQSNGSLTLAGITLQNGYAMQGGAILNSGALTATNCTFKNHRTFAIYGTPGAGGAIYTKGLLNLNQCTFEQNSAASTNVIPIWGSVIAYPARGGGVFIESGKMTVQNCSWLQNSAEGGRGSSSGYYNGGPGYGGAIFAMAGELECINNTFAYNQVIGGQGAPAPLSGVGYPGGDAKGAAVFVAGATCQIRHATIAFNKAIPGCGGLNWSAFGVSGPYGIGAGAGVYNESGTIFLANSILATNLLNGPVDPRGYGDPSSQFSYVGNYFGPVIDLQFNISSDDTIPVIKSRTDPQLGPLDFYSGITKTFCLLPTSPAIDFSNIRYSPATDQRGISRASGRTADAGAFELQLQPVSSSNTTALRTQILAGGKIALTNASYFNIAEPIEVLKDTEIDATHGSAVFDGLGGSRIFHVAPGVKFTLINASIINGCARSGAGILNEGQSQLANCQFNGNAAIGVSGLLGSSTFTRGGAGGPGSDGDAGRGGAIDNIASLVTSNCFFFNNTAAGGKGGDGATGGPAESYYLLNPYRGCRSTSLGGSGGHGGSGGIGAGAAIYNSGTASIHGSQFGFNTTVGGAGGRGGDSGVKGCAAFGPNNRAGDAGNGADARGAICSTGVLIITESTFEQNVALGGAGGTGGVADPYNNIQGFGGAGGSAGGGALFLGNAATLTNVTIANCVAHGGTGGSVGFTAYTIGVTNKSAAGGNATGGAINNSAATTLVNCTFVQNEVIAGDGGPANGDWTIAGLPGSANASTLYNGPWALTLRNSIFSTGHGTNALTGGFIDGGHNIANGPAPGFTSATSMTNTDPRLVEVDLVEMLPIYRPALDSPARDAISANESPAIDQRGVLRPVGAAADIGAIELAPSEIPPVVTLGTSATISLEFIGHPATDYALYTTTDFRVWSPAITNRADNIGRFSFESLDRVSAPWRFYMPRGGVGIGV